MATRNQIIRLTSRVEALALASEAGARPAYVWRNTDESEEEALARHYKDRPEDRRAKQTLIFQWLGTAATHDLHGGE